MTPSISLELQLLKGEVGLDLLAAVFGDEESKLFERGEGGGVINYGRVSLSFMYVCMYVGMYLS